MTRISSLLLLTVAGVSAGSAEGPASSPDLVSAQQRAGREGKVVVAAFVEAGQRSSDQTIDYLLRDPMIVNRLGRTACLVILNRTKSARLFERNHVKEIPTIVIWNSEGAELRRLTGFRKSGEFLGQARDVLDGKDLVAEARATLAGKHRENPIRRLNLADALRRAGQYSEALREYTWCFDHGQEHDLGPDIQRPFGLERHYDVPEGLAKLGEKYPPAMVALRQRRDACVGRLHAGAVDPETVEDLVALNRVLKEQQNILAVYDELARESPVRGLLFDVALFVEARRYTEVLAVVEPKEYLDQMVRRHYRPICGLEVAGMRSHVVVKTVPVFEALLAAKRFDDAQQLQDRIIGYSGSGRTYVRLIEHAVRAGAYVAARKLVQRGLASVPAKQQPMIRAAGRKIPKGKDL